MSPQTAPGRHEATHVAADEALLAALSCACQLTAREAEVVLWVARGKTSPDIAGILGNSPRTVNKHLEHVFDKLGVETRAAAAALAMQRVRIYFAAGARVNLHNFWADATLAPVTGVTKPTATSQPPA